MTRTMREEEWRAFLSVGTSTAKLATTRKDGRPHVTPIWFVLDDQGSLVFTTGADTVKGRAIKRDPRVSLCVDDQEPPYDFVTVEGDVEISDDLQELLDWATRIGNRYMGADRAEEFGRRNAVPTELLVRVQPSRVIARAGVAD